LENLYFNKWENLEEINKFLDAFDLQELNHMNIKHVSRFVMSNEIEAVISNLPTKESPSPDGLTAKFYQMFKELTPMRLKLFHRIERDRTHSMKTVLP
jgi:hypothetical protein